MDEACMNTFWIDRKSRDEAKLVFEGQGYICENKHKDARLKWETIPIIVTSNNLPYILGAKPEIGS